MKYRKLLISAVSITAAVTILAGCAAQSGGKSKDKKTDDYEPAATAECDDYYCAETVAYYDDYASSYDAGLSYKSDVTLDAAEWEYTDYDYDSDYYYEDTSAVTDSSSKVLDPEAERLLIRTVSMEVKTTTYDELCNNVNNKINEYGGYIEYLSAYGTGEEEDLRYAYYTIRVPAENLDALIESLDGTCTVVSKSESTSDVTLDYVDTQAYLEALQIEYDQLLEMLDQTTDLDTILVLQSELTDIRYDIEYAESCLRVMENQVTYATLNLTVNEITEEKAQEEEEDKLKEQEEKEKPEPTFEEEIAETFNASVENAKEFFKDLFLDLVSVAIIVVPIAVLVIIAVIVLCVVIHKKKKAKKAAAKKEEKEEVKN
ncbi:MAG: DUF4349 domain-containing protein [Clostridiales bacterium]|nr:DUF4349 domain-containing protein [Clostridiales bacterium]